jgi:hypothetical protein
MVTEGKKIEQRHHPRMETSVRLSPKTLFGQESQIQNISLGGIRIHSQKSYEVGKTLNFKISLSEGDWAETKVRVVWAKKHPADSGLKYYIGCEFVNLPFDMQNEIWLLLDKRSLIH